jgi:hypothetical protein
MRLTALSLRLAAAAAFLAAAPLMAADPVRAPAGDSASNESGGAPQATAPASAPKAKEEHRICRFDPASGSHLRGKKICLTPRQWRDRAGE